MQIPKWVETFFVPFEAQRLMYEIEIYNFFEVYLSYFYDSPTGPQPSNIIMLI